MKIYDANKIIPGLLILIGLFTFPFLYNIGGAGGGAPPPPKPELPKEQKTCVQPLAFMKAGHMQLLNEWRDQVVRQANRVYVGLDGKEFNPSLQNTCMECHTSKVKFCDQCHNYAGVTPYCWDCHIAPKENQ